MKRVWIGVLALSVAMCLPCVGYAAHQQKSASSHSQKGGHAKSSSTYPGQPGKEGRAKASSPPQGQIEKENVILAADLLDAEQTQHLFAVDLIRHDVQPVLIRIHNKGAQAYQFRKADVDDRAIPAVDVATYAYPHPLISGVRVLRWLVLWVPVSIGKAFLSIVPIVDFSGLEGVTRRPLMNSEIRADFLGAEIPDRDLPPGQSVEGFVFLRSSGHGDLLRIKLINVQTQQPLEFEVPWRPSINELPFESLHKIPHP